MLKQALARCDDIVRHLAGCDARLDALPDVRAATRLDIGKTPRSGSKARAEYASRRSVPLDGTSRADHNVT